MFNDVPSLSIRYGTVDINVHIHIYKSHQLIEYTSENIV